MFVELQRLNLTGSLRADLKARFAELANSGAGFDGDPLKWYGEDAAPCLLVFDGLDELARRDDAAADLARRFVSELKFMLQDAAPTVYR